MAVQNSNDISKQIPSKGLDYHFLRKEGLKYIAEMAGDLWTDHNTHDPGITILEALCYAITELSYRVDFDIKDLLASKDGSIDAHQTFFTPAEILSSVPLTINDYRKLLIDIQGVKNAWLKVADADKTFTEAPFYADYKKDCLTYDEQRGAQILIKGLYKVLLDLEEDDELGDLNRNDVAVKIVGASRDWYLRFLFPAIDSSNFEYLLSGNLDVSAKAVVTEKEDAWEVEVVLENNGGKQNLKLRIVAERSPDGQKPSQTEITKVFAPFKNDATKSYFSGIISLYKKKLLKVNNIFNEAVMALHANRNLAEDFVSVELIDTAEISFCADIELKPEVDIEKVHAQILFELENYLNPEVEFYTLKELMDEKIPVEQIFEGPVLHNGFIKTEQLEQTNIRKEINTSDIINFIMDIEGVLSVSDVSFGIFDERSKTISLNMDTRWSVKIDGFKKPFLNLSKTKITYFKDKLPFLPKREEAMDILDFLHAQEFRNKIKGTDADLPLPKGKYRKLENFISVEHELPRFYGVGNNELPESASSERRGQALQLKAYLKFFDQILANFFAQLANAKELFSLNDDVHQSYFGKFVDDVKNVDKVYVDAQKLQSVFRKVSISDDVETVRNREKLLEEKETFYDRRNLFLDHLMARFSESFNDYVLMLYSYNNSESYEKIAQNKIIEDKLSFLRDYPTISRERSLAYNVLGEIWNSNNVSGFEKRIARLSGITDFTRRFLFCVNNIEIRQTTDVVPKYCYEIKDKEGNIILLSELYESRKEIAEMAALLSERVVLKEAYSKAVKDASGKYSLNVLSEEGKVLACVPILFNKIADRDKKRDELINLFKAACPEEGMHLLEHVLLRPRFVVEKSKTETSEELYQLMEVCLDKDCKYCGEEDPYSFHLSIILPYWHERFKTLEFRRYFERKVQQEAPAHCMVKVCWVNNTIMNEYEVAYKAWMEALRDYESMSYPRQNEKERLRITNNKLIEILKSVHSEFPEATLHDCETPAVNAVLLNNSILGTF